MGWFPLSMADQGRPDLTREVALIGAPRRLPRRRAQPTRSGRLSAAGSLEPGVDFRRPAPSQRGSRPRRGTRRGHPVFDPGTTNHVPRLTPTRFARAFADLAQAAPTEYFEDHQPDAEQFIGALDS
jgi:hypothetical protein